MSNYTGKLSSHPKAYDNGKMGVKNTPSKEKAILVYNNFLVYNAPISPPIDSREHIKQIIIVYLYFLVFHYQFLLIFLHYLILIMLHHFH